MVAIPATAPEHSRLRAVALFILLAALVYQSIDVLRLFGGGDAGKDFLALFAGGKAALSNPGRLYDFAYVTGLQDWPYGKAHLRPFIYPPSTLLLFAPLSAASFWLAYGCWTAGSGAVFAYAGLRAGAPWWTWLMPVVWLVAVCGQTTFLVGGLVLIALTLRNRPLAAGALVGLAAAIKPQMLIFLPIALMAEGRWRTILTAAATGLAVCGLSAAIWGVEMWGDWLAALGRFQAEVIFNEPALVDDAITPYAWLEQNGVAGAWAYLLIPVAAGLVWTTFRRTEHVPDRLIAVFGAAIMVSPYAMHYEAALLAPAVAAYLARTQERLWPVYAAAAWFYAIGLPYGPVSVLMALSLPVIRWASVRYSAA